MTKLHNKLVKCLVCISIVGKINDEVSKRENGRKSEDDKKVMLPIYKPASSKDVVKRKVLAYNNKALNYPMTKNKEDIYWKKGLSRLREYVHNRAYLKDESFYYVNVKDVDDIRKVFNFTKDEMFKYYSVDDEQECPFEFELIIRPYYRLGQYDEIDLDEELNALSEKIFNKKKVDIIDTAKKRVESVESLIKKVEEQDVIAKKERGERLQAIRGRSLDSLNKFIEETEGFLEVFEDEDIRESLKVMIRTSKRAAKVQTSMKQKVEDYKQQKHQAGNESK